MAVLICELYASLKPQTKLESDFIKSKTPDNRVRVGECPLDCQLIVHLSTPEELENPSCGVLKRGMNTSHVMNLMIRTPYGMIREEIALRSVRSPISDLGPEKTLSLFIVLGPIQELIA